MLPLKAAHFPTGAGELQSALAAGFAAHGLTARAIEVEAPGWPEVQRLAIDLTDASATRALRWATPHGPEGPEVRVGDLTIRAEPLLLEGTPVRLRLQASDALLHSSAGGALLVLSGSGPGRIEVEIQRADLQHLALEAARAAARERGAEIQDLQLELTSEGGQALRVRAQVSAKMGFMKAHLTLTGRAALDEQLQLHLSGLEVTGQGMASTMAAGFLRPHLEKATQAPISLAVLSLGGVKLRSIELSAGETVRAQAEFSG